MIKLTDISIRRGPYLLFSGVSLDIHDGEKIGLVGDNGSGKSSLLAMMLGEITSDTGDYRLPRDMRISHVAQETPSNDRSALDFVLDGDREWRRTRDEIDRLEASGEGDSAKLFARMEEIDGYSAPARAARLLSGLGFKTDTHGNPTRAFSGGWRVRLNLAQALMAPSDLLLLDEPTNHLDLDAIVWLEDWLRHYPGTLVMISHDRDFIDGCCKRILHIEHNRIRSYSGDYSQFERQRAERLANEQSLFERQQKQIAHMESYIERFRYKASKARQAQSRIKMLEKMQLVAPAHAGSPFSFRFFPCDRVTDPILKLDDMTVGYGDKAVLNNVALSIASGDRIGLLGVNGAGKSTLIKAMAGVLPLMKGERIATRYLKIGYFAQHQMEQLDPLLTPMKQFQMTFPEATTQQIRNFLGGFDFRGERVDEKIGPFSGGEKARLALALIIYDRPNLLLLDEPTNHLDMEMRHALGMAMQEFEGAIILVSHDRSLLGSVTDRLILVRDGTVGEFREDMEAYLKILRQDNLPDRPVERADSRDNTQSKKSRRQASAQLRQQLKPMRDQVRGLDSKMEKTRSKILELDRVLHDPQTYENESTARLAQMMKQKADLEGSLETLELEWMSAAEALETLERSIPA